MLISTVIVSIIHLNPVIEVKNPFKTPDNCTDCPTFFPHICVQILSNCTVTGCDLSVVGGIESNPP